MVKSFDKSWLSFPILNPYLSKDFTMAYLVLEQKAP